MQVYKRFLSKNDTNPDNSLTIANREVVDVYSDPACVLRQDAPDNYCEVTILQSLHSNRKRVSCVHEITINLKSNTQVSQKTCAGYNVSQFF